MKRKGRMKLASLVAFIVAVACSISIAGPANATPVDHLKTGLGEQLSTHDQAKGASVSAHLSRWRPRPKRMSVHFAYEQAMLSAEYAFSNPELALDDYGVGRCSRRNRSKVACYTWVSRDEYDDYGYYVDTILCDWFTTSYFDRGGKGRARVFEGQPECVLLSEV